MPELPDIEVYCEALRARTMGARLLGLRLGSPFVLRTVEPRPAELAGRRIVAVSRLGKRIVFHCAEDLFVVVHLMVAGRFGWYQRGGAEVALRAKNRLAAFDFCASPADGEGDEEVTSTLLLTEAGKKRRASIHLLRGRESLAALDRGGLEVIGCELGEFEEVLARENHTLKRTLTDPRLFSGIGNAYSDEILHRARLSPLRWTSRLDAAQRRRLWEATREVLEEATATLRSEVGDGFPKKVTAFRPEMAVHGKFKQPCPRCAAPVQRIVYAENECNYCAACQTDGKVLADRALSRLLRGDWPRTLQELEERHEGGPG
ncbi:MAG: formamidopyrimidine-DNA glycosylase [Acidobacteria bacterium]|nr:MAG: formamidopyrimidine-DNA glycosylase [Acidobacteriota bacterium]REK07300.1 MAG: formamidopyrimidine-DNA glycosylase [Acidobacteriota bacterium]